MLQKTLMPWIVATSNIPPMLSIETVAGLIAAALAVYFFSSRVLDVDTASARKANNSPPQLLLPVGTIIQSYFDNQFDFLKDGFKATSSTVFQFKLNRHNVIALSGDEGRCAFFREKGLNLYEGFQVLIGNVRCSCGPAASLHYY